MNDGLQRITAVRVVAGSFQAFPKLQIPYLPAERFSLIVRKLEIDKLLFFKRRESR